jgi:hypothetical protein
MTHDSQDRASCHGLAARHNPSRAMHWQNDVGFRPYGGHCAQPFKVDPADFTNSLRGQDLAYQLVNSEVMPRYNSVIRIDYNSLVAAAVPEKYVADQLGINYVTNLEYHNNSIKNPRNYKDLILNWEELHQVYQKWLVAR